MLAIAEVCLGKHIRHGCKAVPEAGGQQNAVLQQNGRFTTERFDTTDLAQNIYCANGSALRQNVVFADGDSAERVLRETGVVSRAQLPAVGAFVAACGT